VSILFIVLILYCEDFDWFCLNRSQVPVQSSISHSPSNYQQPRQPRQPQERRGQEEEDVGMLDSDTVKFIKEAERREGEDFSTTSLSSSSSSSMSSSGNQHASYTMIIGSVDSFERRMESEQLRLIFLPH